MDIKLKYLANEKGERTFEILDDIKYTLKNGKEVFVPKGLKTDFTSAPSWLWSIIKPFDKALLGDIKHDELWLDRVNEIARFSGNIYKARKYADDLRLEIRNELAPNKKAKNYATHYFLRIFGGLYYSRQIQIP